MSASVTRLYCSTAAHVPASQGTVQGIAEQARQAMRLVRVRVIRQTTWQHPCGLLRCTAMLGSSAGRLSGGCEAVRRT